jgi:oxygen-independent coproporphyrinogen III oxidase
MESALIPPLGIYIHIPFCVRKCRYCDFYSITDRDLEPVYIDALIREIQGCNEKSRSVDTLYIGGGTPSVLAPSSIRRIIETVDSVFSVDADAEITIEVNPGTVSKTHFEMYREAGVNRLNIGVQSFKDRLLRFLGRCHTAKEATQAIEWAKQAGFDNIGLDLIYGVPDQTKKGWAADMAQALSFKPKHLSCYLLTFEPGTPLDDARNKDLVTPISETTAANRFLFTSETLRKAGYDHYEISNFALTAANRSRHNQKYWIHAPYIGFGPGAHSFLPPVRRWNLKNVHSYIERIKNGQPPESEMETLSKQQLMIEAIYLGLRQSDGIDTTAFNNQFGERFDMRFEPLLSELSTTGLIDRQDHRYALSPGGMLYADGIAGRFADLIG